MSSEPSSPSPAPQWLVHKFGGSSLACSECYRNVVDIIAEIRQSQLATETSTGIPQRLCVVVSAMGEIKPNSDVAKLIRHYSGEQKKVVQVKKVTDYLIQCTRLAAENNPSYLLLVKELRERHRQVVEELLESENVSNEENKKFHAELKQRLLSELEKDFDDLSYILRAVWLSKTYDVEHNWWFGYGELWSARLMAAFIQANIYRHREQLNSASSSSSSSPTTAKQATTPDLSTV